MGSNLSLKFNLKFTLTLIQLSTTSRCNWLQQSLTFLAVKEEIILQYTHVYSCPKEILSFKEKKKEKIYQDAVANILPFGLNWQKERGRVSPI